jgi:hypothetical protein
VLCPLCQFQVLKVKPGKGYEGSGYNVCPHCFGSPPEGSAEAEAGGGDFPCFRCAHGDICGLAGKVTTVVCVSLCIFNEDRVDICE